MALEKRMQIKNVLTRLADSDNTVSVDDLTVLFAHLGIRKADVTKSLVSLIESNSCRINLAAFVDALYAGRNATREWTLHSSCPTTMPLEPSTFFQLYDDGSEPPSPRVPDYDMFEVPRQPLHLTSPRICYFLDIGTTEIGFYAYSYSYGKSSSSTVKCIASSKCTKAFYGHFVLRKDDANSYSGNIDALAGSSALTEFVDELVERCGIGTMPKTTPDSCKPQELFITAGFTGFHRTLVHDTSKRLATLSFFEQLKGVFSRRFKRQLMVKAFVLSGELEAEFAVRATEWLVQQAFVNLDGGDMVSLFQEFPKKCAFHRLSGLTQVTRAQYVQATLDQGVRENELVDFFNKTDRNADGIIDFADFKVSLEQGDKVLTAFVRKSLFMGTLAAGGGSAQLTMVVGSCHVQVFSAPIGNSVPLKDGTLTVPVTADQRGAWAARVRSALVAANYPKGLKGLFVGISATCYAAQLAGIDNCVVPKPRVVAALAVALDSFSGQDDLRAIANLILLHEMISFAFDDDAFFLFKRSWVMGQGDTSSEFIANWNLGLFIEQSFRPEKTEHVDAELSRKNKASAHRQQCAALKVAIAERQSYLKGSILPKNAVLASKQEDLLETIALNVRQRFGYDLGLNLGAEGGLRPDAPLRALEEPLKASKAAYYTATEQLRRNESDDFEEVLRLETERLYQGVLLKASLVTRFNSLRTGRRTLRYSCPAHARSSVEVEYVGNGKLVLVRLLVIGVADAGVQPWRVTAGHILEKVNGNANFDRKGDWLAGIHEDCAVELQFCDPTPCMSDTDTEYFQREFGPQSARLLALSYMEPDGELLQPDGALGEDETAPGPLMQQAVEAQDTLRELVAPSVIWEPAGKPGRSTTRECHYCDFAFNTGHKSFARIRRKADYKYQHLGIDKYRRVHDMARLSFQFNTCKAMLVALKLLRSDYRIVMIENRFDKPTAVGWRDITILVELDLRSGARHICEIQLSHKLLNDARAHVHHHYVALREELPNACQVRSQDLDAVQAVILEELENWVDRMFPGTILEVPFIESPAIPACILDLGSGEVGFYKYMININTRKITAEIGTKSPHAFLSHFVVRDLHEEFVQELINGFGKDLHVGPEETIVIFAGLTGVHREAMASPQAREDVRRFIARVETMFYRSFQRRLWFRVFVPSGELEAQFEFYATEWLIRQVSIDVHAADDWVINGAWTDVLQQTMFQDAGEAEISQAHFQDMLSGLGLRTDVFEQVFNRIDTRRVGSLRVRDLELAISQRDEVIMAFLRQAAFVGTMAAGSGSAQISYFDKSGTVGPGVRRRGTHRFFSAPVGNKIATTAGILSSPVTEHQQEAWIARVSTELQAAGFPRGLKGLFVGISAMYYAAQACGCTNTIMLKSEAVAALTAAIGKLPADDLRSHANLIMCREILLHVLDDRAAILFKRNWVAAGKARTNKYIATWSLGWYITQFEVKSLE